MRIIKTAAFPPRKPLPRLRIEEASPTERARLSLMLWLAIIGSGIGWGVVFGIVAR